IRALGAREIASGVGVLTRPRPVGWLWGRVAGDLVDLGLLGAATTASEHRGRVAASAALIGGVLALDLLCADRLSRLAGSRRMDFASTGALYVRKFVTINASPDSIYAFWRRLENL